MKRFCQPLTRWLGLFALFFLNSSVALAQLPAGIEKVRSLEGFTEYRLANDARVLLYPDPSSNRVTVNMTVFVGSRHEGYGETGMAHLLEHMLFKGCTKFPDVPRALRDHGADYNGTTWLDRTNYYETMPASDANLEFGIQLEADRLINSFIKREDLASEMTVVRNEFEAGENDPLGILSQRMMATAFEWHNYGKSTIGNRSDIERVPIEALQAFYRKFYQPDNILLVVGGKFDEKKALEHIARYFGPIKKPTRKLPSTYTEEPPQDGERTVTLRRVGKVGAIGAIYHICAGAHEDYPACEVLASILDTEPTGRLYEALVKTKKATRVNAFALGLHDPGVLEILAQVDLKDEKGINGVKDAMIEVLENLHRQKITDEEVDRARTKLLRDRALLMNSPQRVAITLSEWASKGDWRLFLLHRDRLEKVTKADVERVIKRYLTASNRTAGVFIPTDAPQRAVIPSTPNVGDLLKDYKGRAAVASGEAFDPTPDNIEKRTRRVELPSGVKAAFLPKKTRAEAVQVNLVLHFGNEESLKGNTIAAEFLGTLLQRGSKDLSRKEITDQLNKLGARVSISSSTGTLHLSITARRSTLEDVLKIVRKMLREPTFPSDEFDVYKRQVLESLSRNSTEPFALAQTALRRALDPQPKDNVRYVPTLEEKTAMVKELTVEQVRKLYAEQLGGGHGELAVVGDFDLEKTRALFEDLLKGWKSSTPYRRIDRKANLTVKGQRITINTPDKENAIYVAAHTLALKDSDPDYPALEMGNFLLGGSDLASRLGKRVRGKEGLSYGVGSQVRASSEDEEAVFVIFAICNPVNLAKVDVAVLDEVNRFLKEGIADKELSDGIKGYLLDLQNARGSDANLAFTLAEYLKVGRTFAYEADLEKKIQALKPETIKSVFARRVDPKRLVIVQAGDLKKASSEKK